MPKLTNDLPGGKADGKDLESYDQNQLLKGALIEFEHTTELAKAIEIATDHLEEDPKYYDHLEDMEKKYAGADSIDLETGDGLGSYVEDEILAFAPPELVEDLRQKYQAEGKNLSDLSEEEMIDLLDDLLDFNVTGSYRNTMKYTSAQVSTESWDRIAEACHFERDET